MQPPDLGSLCCLPPGAAETLPAIPSSSVTTPLSSFSRVFSALQLLGEPGAQSSARFSSLSVCPPWWPPQSTCRSPQMCISCPDPPTPSPDSRPMRPAACSSQTSLGSSYLQDPHPQACSSFSCSGKNFGVSFDLSVFLLHTAHSHPEPDHVSPLSW